MYITFYKYNGTGNDFIIIDNRLQAICLTQKSIHCLCDRHFGIGADGLILLEKDKTGFVMRYYNADGRESTLCGNGGRCFTAFAHKMGLTNDDTFTFSAIDGQHTGKITPNKQDVNSPFVKLEFNDATIREVVEDAFYIDTGSPHWVSFFDEVNAEKIFNYAHQIRYSTKFKKEGINVNIVTKTKDKAINMRTYERGVEDETLSCGTGAVAAAIATYKKWNFIPKYIQTLGGKLYVDFKKSHSAVFENIYLSGNVQFVFSGEINLPSAKQS